MVRSSTPRPTRQNRETERLIALALALSASGSRVEDIFWERQIEAVLSKLLRSGQDSALEAALDHLLTADLNAYEVLIELCETQSESTIIEADGKRYDVLLLVAPVAAWTRYQIPIGKIRPELHESLQAHLHSQILATNAQLALAPALLSIEQMPRTFSATQQWLIQLGTDALQKGSQAKFQLPDISDAPGMLADTRYLVGAVVVPEGEPVFRWQEGLPPQVSRAHCLEQWTQQVEPIFAALLPGCGVEVLLPEAWYVANREADRRVRPLAIQAAVTWLEAALGSGPDQIRAVIAGCGEQQIDEYRIGFTQRQSNSVVYGCIWPLFGREDTVEPGNADEPETPLDVMDHIANLLRQQGITDIRRIPGLLAPEVCEDCGTPYFPDPTGEMVHAELPEDVEYTPQQFH